VGWSGASATKLLRSGEAHGDGKLGAMTLGAGLPMPINVVLDSIGRRADALASSNGQAAAASAPVSCGRGSKWWVSSRITSAGVCRKQAADGAGSRAFFSPEKPRVFAWGARDAPLARRQP
jgi:hypothetical protein